MGGSQLVVFNPRMVRAKVPGRTKLARVRNERDVVLALSLIKQQPAGRQQPLIGALVAQAQRAGIAPKRVVELAWNEHQHPRDREGKFTERGGVQRVVPTTGGGFRVQGRISREDAAREMFGTREGNRRIAKADAKKTGISKITTKAPVLGTDPTTGRQKLAKGTGQVVGVRDIGHHGPVTVVKWENGVRSYHPRNLDNSNVQGLPDFSDSKITATGSVQGTNPATGLPKAAKGTGRIVAIEESGYYGPVAVVEWTNGVRSYHSRDLDNSKVKGLPW